MADHTEKSDSVRDEMERIYTQIPPAEIPWNIESPPRELVRLVETGQLQPCKTIDLGCGAGNYAIYLAGKGFDVTGVDVSPTAIALARDNAKKKAATCSFLVADVLGGLEEIADTFQFAYDWSLLHHIHPDRRREYVDTVRRLLVPGGRYLSVCFSEKDTAFGGSGKCRRTPLGTLLFFSSEEELRGLLEPHFRVLVLRTAAVEGKVEPHLMNYALVEKRGETSAFPTR